MALSVGLPGVIAHGMYTMALAARAVATWFPGAEVVSLGCKFTNPVVVPAEGGVDIEVAGEVKGSRGRPDHGGADRHLRRPEGARHARAVLRQVLRRCLKRLADHTTLRVGGPADALGRARPPRPS